MSSIFVKQYKQKLQLQSLNFQKAVDLKLLKGFIYHLKIVNVLRFGKANWMQIWFSSCF